MQQWLYLFLALPTIFKVNSSAKTYRAAVLEYAPDTTPDDTPETIFKKSVSDYVKYIKEASRRAVDIIVFPELGLSSSNIEHFERNLLEPYTFKIPSADAKVTPCNHTDRKVAWQLRELSCAAAQHKIYVVINLSESVNCAGEIKCADNDLTFYNTEVVFDRNGVLIARYRKVNLFYEIGFNVTKVPDVVSFATDFGVNFGIVTCFDLFFKTPGIDLIRKYDIHDFVFSTAWYSELPFSTSVQFHAGWSYGNDVALLASCYDFPENTNQGSGIYVGRNGIAQTISPKIRTNKMLISDVPKYQFRKGYKLKDVSREDKVTDNDEREVTREDLSAYTTVQIPFGKFQTTLCQKRLCCEFDVETTPDRDPQEQYRAVVFNGKRNVVVAVGSVQVCAIVNCLNDTLGSCGVWNKNTDPVLIFHKISIQGNFTIGPDTAQFPSTVDANLLPLGYSEFEFKTKGNLTEMRLLKSRQRIATFGILGRNYVNDQLLEFKNSTKSFFN